MRRKSPQCVRDRRGEFISRSNFREFVDDVIVAVSSSDECIPEPVDESLAEARISAEFILLIGWEGSSESLQQFRLFIKGRFRRKELQDVAVSNFLSVIVSEFPSR